MKLRTLIFLTLAVAPAPLLSAVEAVPTLAFHPEAVEVSGVTPTGRVLLFGVMRQQVGYETALIRRQGIVIDSDANGAVRFELGRSVSMQSVWVAIDLLTGLAVSASPAGFELTKADVSNAISRSPAGRLNRIVLGREYLEAVAIRPAVGSWSLTVGDGTELDADGAIDFKIALDLDRFDPIGEGPSPPTDFQIGDSVFLIDPARMELFSVKVTGVLP